MGDFEFLKWFLFGYAIFNYLVLSVLIYHPRSNGDRRAEPLDFLLLGLIYVIAVGGGSAILGLLSYITGSILPLLLILGCYYHITAFCASAISDIFTGRQILMHSGLEARRVDPQVQELQAQVANQQAQIANLSDNLNIALTRNQTHNTVRWPLQQYRLGEPEKPSDPNPRESPQRRIIRRETNDSEV